MGWRCPGGLPQKPAACPLSTMKQGQPKLKGALVDNVVSRLFRMPGFNRILVRLTLPYTALTGTLLLASHSVRRTLYPYCATRL
jgi:hypothetical protein